MMILGKTMPCCKVRRISRAKLTQENFAHPVLLYFIDVPIIDEKN